MGRSSAAQAQTIAAIQPITVQPTRRFSMKIPVNSRFLCPMIDGRKYSSVMDKRNIMAPLLPLCITVQAGNLFHQSCNSSALRALCPANVFAERLPSLRFRDFRQELCESLLAVLLIEPLINFSDLRRVHRAELRSAHGAELRFLVKIIRQGFIVHRTGRFGIERKLKLLVPIEQKTRIA